MPTKDNWAMVWDKRGVYEVTTSNDDVNGIRGYIKELTTKHCVRWNGKTTSCHCLHPFTFRPDLLFMLHCYVYRFVCLDNRQRNLHILQIIQERTNHRKIKECLSILTLCNIYADGDDWPCRPELCEYRLCLPHGWFAEEPFQLHIPYGWLLDEPFVTWLMGEPFLMNLPMLEEGTYDKLASDLEKIPICQSALVSILKLGKKRWKRLVKTINTGGTEPQATVLDTEA